LGFTDFQLHWLEFSSDGIAATAGVGLMAINTANPLFLGDYPASSGIGGPYLNVVKTAATAGIGILANTDVYNNYMDTYQAGAGYIGEVAWIPQTDNPLTASGYNYVPSNIITDYYSDLKSIYSSYNSEKYNYDQLKDAYNYAVLVKHQNYFDPIAVPERPCPP
jgi:hypothetical protein